MATAFEHLMIEWSTGLLWIVQQILFQVPLMENYFWMVTVFTALVMVAEWCIPWRTDQHFLRKDWFTDLMYMYANIFLFAVLLDGLYSLFSMLLPSYGQFTTLGNAHWVIQLAVLFMLQDFLQWCIHRVLHSNTFLWRFHQIHHSVEEMGVSSHFRYHWMENVLYKPSKMAALSLFGGIEPKLAILVHLGTLVIGHLNHANLKLDLGPLKYLFNSPTMHLLHHSKSHLARGGVNFGLSLSCWDYLFHTAAEPTVSGDVELGFEGMEKVPKHFTQQLVHGFRWDENS